MLSQDGHVSSARDAADDGPLAVLARLLLLIAPVGLLGLVALSAGVVEPAVRAGGVAPPGRPAAEAEGFRSRAEAALAGRARWWWTAWWALVAAGAAGLLLAPVALLDALGEGPGELGTLLLDTRDRDRVVGPGGGARGRGAWRAWPCAAAGRPPALGPAIALGLPPAVALAAISWAGHASSGGDRTANIVIDAIHNGATAVWLGGLLGLAVLALPAARALAPGDRVRLAAGVVVRFSALALDGGRRSSS